MILPTRTSFTPSKPSLPSARARRRPAGRAPRSSGGRDGRLHRAPPRPRFLRDARAAAARVSGTNASPGDLLVRRDVALGGADADVVGHRRRRRRRPCSPARCTSGARSPCRAARDPGPRAKRSSYVFACQKRDESGVWISSMTTSLPSFVRPNSYLVSTRMSPRSAQMRCPAAKSFIAMLGRLVEVLRRHVPGGEDLLARAGHVVLALGGLGGRREDGLGQLLVLLQPLGQRVAAEVADAALVVRPQAGRRRARGVRAHDHLDEDRRALDALEDVGVGHARSRGSATTSLVCSNHQAAMPLSTWPLKGMVPSTRSKALMRSVTTMKRRPSRVV